MAVNPNLEVLICWGCHGLGGVNNISLLSHNSGGYKSEKVLTGLASPGGSLLGVWTAIFSLSSYGRSSVCIRPNLFL